MTDPKYVLINVILSVNERKYLVCDGYVHPNVATRDKEKSQHPSHSYRTFLFPRSQIHDI